MEELAEALEIRFLANRNDNLCYSLLTDFADASQQTLPTDALLTDLATEKINELNAKYGNGRDIFFLFHRPRLWNAQDKIWMGYERKRGKLTELNALLAHGATQYFSIIVGNLEFLQGVKYVISLDTDTQLPRDSAWKLVATMAHPLNHPLYDEKKLRVTEGYGILQPRVAISLPKSSGTLYNQMHANDAGIDPYTRLTSDVYQDLFNEGSFIGKGIYEIETFEKALNGRFPDNRILSHDLLEGCYARAGLLSDVQLYEEYPSRYSSDVSRRHRWIRGDWQIGWWFLPMVPDAKRNFNPNTLSALSRWKIFDNLRRSLVPVALMAILLLGWTVFEAPLFYTLSVLAVLVFPSAISAMWSLLHLPKEVSLKLHILSVIEGLSGSLLQNVYTLVCLPYEAYYTIDAIMRTSWRMLVSHKHLLEWTPSTGVERKKGLSLPDAFLTMWISPFIALATTVLLIMYYPVALFFASPLLVLWLAAPGITWWISRPPSGNGLALSPSQVAFLHKIARKTWGFFERFVTAEDNWLPPDNYQEEPKETIAHRTSPTNIGLSLLANLAAYDFGYITAGSVLERTSNTVEAMEAMERQHGHFYNWYDTTTLAPLLPRYISTVDSGNLAGHLLTLRQGLIALPGDPVIPVRCFEGFRDTMCIIEEYVHESALFRKISLYLHDVCESSPTSAFKTKECLEWMVQASAELLAEVAAGSNEDAHWWALRMQEQSEKAYDELVYLLPWLLQPSGTCMSWLQ